MSAVIVLAILGVFIGFVLTQPRRSRRRRVESMRVFAQGHGLEPTTLTTIELAKTPFDAFNHFRLSPGPAARGRWHGIDVVVFSYSWTRGRSRQSYYAVIASLPLHGPRLVIGRETAATRRKAQRDIAVGDAPFDQRFLVKGDDDAAQALLDPLMRQWLNGTADTVSFELVGSDLLVITQQVSLSGRTAGLVLDALLAVTTEFCDHVPAGFRERFGTNGWPATGSATGTPSMPAPVIRALLTRSRDHFVVGLFATFALFFVLLAALAIADGAHQLRIRNTLD